jgi:hypothetical protein
LFWTKEGEKSEIGAPVLEYLKDLWNKGLPVTKEALMSEAKECARNSNIPFRASCGWCENLSLQRRTKISQKLPLEFETKLTEFQHFVIWPCRRNNYSLSQFGSADEIAFFFNMPHNYTINLKVENKWQWKPQAVKSYVLLNFLIK